MNRASITHIVYRFGATISIGKDIRSLSKIDLGARSSRLVRDAAIGLVTVALIFVSRSLAAMPGHFVHSAEMGRFVVKWHLTTDPIQSGDVVEVFQSGITAKNRRPPLTRVYKFFEKDRAVWLESACVWRGPSNEDGVMLTLTYGVGTGRRFVILGTTRHGFRKVFDKFSDRIDTIGDDRSLEMVDLIGDGGTEIVYVPSYANFREADPGDTRAQVWEWDRSSEHYVKVRDSAYLRRLEPLRTNSVSAQKRAALK
jgi:hypothetical protein